MNYRIEFKGSTLSESSLTTSAEVIERLQNLDKNEKPSKIFKVFNDGRGVDVISKFKRYFKTGDAKTALDKAIKACDTGYVIKSYEGEGFKEKKNNGYYFSKKKSEWKVFSSQEEAQKIARNLPSAYVEKL